MSRNGQSGLLSCWKISHSLYSEGRLRSCWSTCLSPVATFLCLPKYPELVFEPPGVFSCWLWIRPENASVEFVVLFYGELIKVIYKVNIRQEKESDLDIIMVFTFTEMSVDTAWTGEINAAQWTGVTNPFAMMSFDVVGQCPKRHEFGFTKWTFVFLSCCYWYIFLCNYEFAIFLQCCLLFWYHSLQLNDLKRVR